MVCEQRLFPEHQALLELARSGLLSKPISELKKHLKKIEMKLKKEEKNGEW